MPHIAAGVDCHKDTHVVAFLDPLGRVLGTRRVGQTPEEFARAVEAARAFGAEAGEVRWGLESTGSYGRRFANYLAAVGEVVYEVPSALTHRSRRHGRRLGKSDEIDACAIAEVVLRDGDALGRHRGEGVHDELCLLYDHRDRLVRDRTQAVNRLRHAAMRIGLTGLAKDPSRPSAVTRLRRRMAALAFAPGVEAALATEVRFALDTLALLALQIRELETAIRPLAERYRELGALTGASHVAIAGIVGHPGDLRNLRSADAFAMRSGTAPVPCSSGRNQRVRINHRGDRQLNRLLYIIALVQIRFATHPGRLYYQRKLQEGKTPRAALRALKRRLATVVYYRLLADTAALAPPGDPSAAPVAA
jgi:transposase